MTEGEALVADPRYPQAGRIKAVTWLDATSGVITLNGPLGTPYRQFAIAATVFAVSRASSGARRFEFSYSGGRSPDHIRGLLKVGATIVLQ